MIGPTEEGGFSEDEIKAYDAWMEAIPLLRATTTAPLMLPLSPPPQQRRKFTLARYSTHAPPPPATRKRAPGGGLSTKKAARVSSSDRRRQLMGKVPPSKPAKSGKLRIVRKPTKGKIGRPPKAPPPPAPVAPSGPVSAPIRPVPARLHSHAAAPPAAGSAGAEASRGGGGGETTGGGGAAGLSESPPQPSLERIERLLAEGASPSPVPPPLAALASAPVSRSASPAPRPADSRPRSTQPIDLTLSDSDDEADVARTARRPALAAPAPRLSPFARVPIVSGRPLSAPHPGVYAPAHGDLLGKVDGRASPLRLSSHGSPDPQALEASGQPPPQQHSDRVRVYNRPVPAVYARGAAAWLPSGPPARSASAAPHSAFRQKGMPVREHTGGAAPLRLHSSPDAVAAAAPGGDWATAARGARRALSFANARGYGAHGGQRAASGSVNLSEYGLAGGSAADIRARLELMCSAAAADAPPPAHNPVRQDASAAASMGGCGSTAQGDGWQWQQ